MIFKQLEEYNQFRIRMKLTQVLPALIMFHQKFRTLLQKLLIIPNLNKPKILNHLTKKKKMNNK